MICVSIAGQTAEECISALKGLEFAEIRLDKLEKPSTGDVRRIFSQPVKLMATCRPGEGLDESARKHLLLEAIESGAAFVDVEVEASDAFKKEVVEKARAAGCKVIVSFHDFDKTPPKAELEQIVEWCFESGADIAKIACKADSEKDCARLMGLLDSERKMVVVGMGEKGKITRVVAPLLGSRFTFASLGKGRETAEGQPDAGSLKEIMDALRDL